MKRFTFKGVLDNFRQSVSQPTKSEQPELVETLKTEHCQLARVSCLCLFIFQIFPLCRRFRLNSLPYVHFLLYLLLLSLFVTVVGQVRLSLLKKQTNKQKIPIANLVPSARSCIKLSFKFQKQVTIARAMIEAIHPGSTMSVFFFRCSLFFFLLLYSDIFSALVLCAFSS